MGSSAMLHCSMAALRLAGSVPRLANSGIGLASPNVRQEKIGV
jgi:hypothetical protein